MWDMPKQVTGADVVFGGRMNELLPQWKDIPEEFRRETATAKKWTDVVDTWFFCGLKNAQWKPKEGINQADALRHLKAIMGSFEPKHEHKTAAVAFLMSKWFDDVTYEAAKANA